MSLGYSGSTTFTFDIERYKNRDSGKLISSDKFMDDDGFEYDYQIIPLQIEGEAYYSPGRTYGPPEDCEPPSGDVEIISVIGPDGTDWYDRLTQSEIDLILQMIEDGVADQ